MQSTSSDSAGTTLCDNAFRRQLTLCALYFAQGLPWGFMTVALASHLKSKGMTLEETGWLLSMSTLPWTFKLFWAPVIDSVTLRSMGRRRPWILLAQLMMAFTLITLVMIGNLSEQLTLLGWMFFLHNCFASLQDVSTDALAIDILTDAERGRVNGMMWGSKILGVGFGSAAMGTLLARTTLEITVLAQTVLILAIMTLPLWFRERPGEKRFPWSRGQAQPDPISMDVASLRSPVQVLSNLLRAFSLPATVLAALFTATALIGQGTNATLVLDLYVQEEENVTAELGRENEINLGWSPELYAQVTGVLGTVLEVVAALLGGYLADRYGQRKFIASGYGGFGLLAVTFGLSDAYWTTTWFATGYLVVAPAFLALGTVSGFSLFMRISWTTAAATMFTCYMALSNVGDVIGKGLLANSLHKSFDYPTCFCLLGIVTLIPLILLCGVDARTVERAKLENQESPEPVAPED
jgi:PAT family beta-lactamase induction signal transducer AmpG